MGTRSTRSGAGEEQSTKFEDGNLLMSSSLILLTFSFTMDKPVFPFLSCIVFFFIAFSPMMSEAKDEDDVTSSAIGIVAVAVHLASSNESEKLQERTGLTLIFVILLVRASSDRRCVGRGRFRRLLPLSLPLVLERQENIEVFLIEESRCFSSSAGRP